jgi:hypothetical protein
MSLTRLFLSSLFLYNVFTYIPSLVRREPAIHGSYGRCFMLTAYVSSQYSYMLSPLSPLYFYAFMRNIPPIRPLCRLIAAEGQSQTNPSGFRLESSTCHQNGRIRGSRRACKNRLTRYKPHVYTRRDPQLTLGVAQYPRLVILFES